MVSHSANRLKRIVRLVETIKEHEGVSEKAILAQFCLKEGAHPTTAKQYLEELRITGKVSPEKECVYICVKKDE